MTGILGIGLRSLLAYQNALSITSQNIENAHRPFYARRQFDFVEGLFGSGTYIGDVRRVIDKNADNLVISNTSEWEKTNLILERFADFENMIDDENSSIKKFIADAISTLKQTGSDQSRSAFLNRLSSLANKFNTVSNDIANRKEEVNRSISTEVESINSVLDQIANINRQLTMTTPEGRDALLDKQFELLQTLSKSININTSTDSSGIVRVMLDNGLDLVAGDNSYHISTTPNPENAEDININMSVGSNTVKINQFVKSGKLSALIEYKKTGLSATERAISRLAIAISELLNKQNNLGIDLYGDLGSNIFNDMNDASLSSSRVIANGDNVGTASMTATISDVNELTTSDYRLSFDTPTHYTLVRLCDGKEMSNGDITSTPATITADGFSINISSISLSAGDKFLIQPTRNAAGSLKTMFSDASKIAFGFPVRAKENVSNLGNGVIDVVDITDTTTPAFATAKQLSPPIKIEFLTDTTYQIVNASTNAVMEGPLTYDPNAGASIFPTPGGYDPGYRVSLTGKIKSGDTFNIDYNVNPTGDNRNSLKMTKVFEENTMGNGTLNFTSAYQLLSGEVSSKAYSAQLENESAKSLYNQAIAYRANVSGVSLPEEATNLTQFQECYAASAQIVQAAKEIFDILIRSTRG